ncbi:UNKNOWN [Stylonychia lemnae]|uniref:Uncharacterized protein n=1 Tax=Stylonychia lemnae TaxID=5949 RepID=A0A077ZY64_STYLE|nr:UNKNOWN [Stylonychia lemnae]|eukprot:CDW73486.1 UNKNOWN [Stylonychia lemnae]
MAVLSSSLIGVDARKRLQEVRVPKKDVALKNTRRLMSPKVSDDCGCLTLLDSSLCLTMTSPMIKAGWQFYQSYSTGNPWIIRFRPNVESQANIQTQLTVKKTYYNELTLTVDSFRANVFGEIAFWQSGSICLNTGYEIEAILVTAQTAMKFYDCYRAIIYTLFNWDQYKTVDFMNFFDTCSFSDAEQLTLKEWDLINADKIKYLTGDGTETNCFPTNLINKDLTDFALNFIAPILNPVSV